MNRTPVSSSLVVSAGYDAEEGLLEIELANGTVYRYYGVPSTIYDELIQADSAGRYFNDAIANGDFEYERVD